MNQEATKLPQEPNKEMEDATGLGGGELEKKPKVDLQTAPGSTASLMRDNVVAGASSSPLLAPGV